MASGDVVGEIIDVMPPASSYATLDVLVGTSSPVENIKVFDFDASSAEYMDFLCRLNNHYDGGGLTLKLVWSATSTAGGSAYTRWEAAIRAIVDDAEDVNTTAHTYDFNGVSDLPASAVGEVSYCEITFTNGADMDALAAGELFILRIKRNVGHADDTMAGDAELWTVTIKET